MEGLPTDADIETKYARSIQVGGIVELAVVPGDNRREGHLLFRFEVVPRVVDKEGVTRARPIGRPGDVHPREGVGDVLDDRFLVHGCHRIATVPARPSTLWFRSVTLPSPMTRRAAACL